MLFDYQHFERNASLETLIRETEAHYARPLSDDDLTLVNAAGEPAICNGISIDNSTIDADRNGDHGAGVGGGK